MSIDQSSQRWDGGCIKTTRCKFDHRNNLLMRQMKPLHNLANRGPGFQIVEDNGNRRPTITEYPSAATLARDALHGGTLGPIETSHNGAYLT